MTALELFIVLVALAFLGGIHAARRPGGVWGLSSGVEYVLLGVVLGPHLLGLVTRASVREFEALWLMALGWLLAVRGIDVGARRGTPGFSAHFFSSLGATALCCGSVFVTVWIAARLLGVPGVWSLSLGLAAVCSESFGERANPAEQVRNSSARFTTGTELVPMLALACMTVGGAAIQLALPPPLAGLLLSTALGFLLGGVVTALVRVHFDVAETWPLVLGAVLLVVGTALRLALPAVSSAFILGLTIGVLSRHRIEVRDLVATTERQVLLPCLLLAGVVLDWTSLSRLWLVIFAALGTRVLFKVGWGLAFGRGEGFGERLLLGRGLLRSSGVSIAVGLVVFLRQPDAIGRTVMIAAVLSVLVGELSTPRRREAPPSESPDWPGSARARPFGGHRAPANTETG